MATDFYTNEDGFIQYTATEDQTRFDFDWYTDEASQIKTYLGDMEINESTVWINSNKQGGYVTLAPQLAGTIITLRREQESKRVTNFTATGYITADLLNKEFDNLARTTGQVQHSVERSLHLSEYESQSIDCTLPTPEANKSVRWNSQGDALESVEFLTFDDYSTSIDRILEAEASCEEDALISATNAMTSIINAQLAQDAADSVVFPIPVGDGLWEEGKTFNEYPEYMVYNELRYTPIIGIALPYTVGATPDLTKVKVVGETNDTNNIYNPETIQAAIDYEGWNVSGGEVLNVQGYYAAGIGRGRWKTALASSVTVNGYSVVQCVGVPTLALVLQETNIRSALSWGYDPSVTADNDEVNGLFFASIKDGDYIDFSGMMFRVYGSVNGVPSSIATPSTTNAVETNEMAYLFQKKNITFSAGGLYAANQDTAGVKHYFPSTLAIHECEGVHFESGSTFESKGESYGDADASFYESFARRQEFLAVNGGHAVVCIASKTITGSPTCRLSGSVGPLYFSSCDDFRLESPFSNPASLGYAAYSSDAWAGTLAYVGFNQFHGFINNPVAHKEELFRREDGVTSVGSSVYCGKGGVVTEDRDVSLLSSGGFIADMYANGSAKTIGYAFAAGSGSSNKNIGCKIRRCQEVAYAFWSVNSPVNIEVLNMDAETGLTGLMVSEQSFGSGYAELTGKLRIDDSRVWAGETEELTNTSVVACLKKVSNMKVCLDLDAKGRVDLFNVKQGNIFSLINNSTEACYGGVYIKGGVYETDGYLIRSAGWGGSAANSMAGLVVADGVTINDFSTAATDAYINYSNQSGSGVQTYIYHNLEGADIAVKGFRSLNNGYSVSGTSLNELILMPRKLGVTTYTTEAFRPRETLAVEFTSIVSLSGANSRMAFVMSDGRPPVGNNCWITSDAGLVKVLLVYAPTVSGPLRCELLLEGDVRTSFTTSNTYTLIGG